MLICFVLLTGCSAKKAARIERTTKDGTDQQLTFSFLKTWKVVENESSFDLQMTDDKEQNVFSVFVYNKADFTEEKNYTDVFNRQLATIFGQRDNTELEEELPKKELDDKTIITKLYSADFSDARNYYYASLIEFKGDSQVFAFVLGTTLPDDFKDIQKEWDAILESAVIATPENNSSQSQTGSSSDSSSGSSSSESDSSSSDSSSSSSEGTA